MQIVFLEQHPQAKINLLIVWLKMYAVDSHEEVENASRLFNDDPRVTQFFDPEKISGLEVAVGLGAKSGDVAWDVYLFFDGQAEWVDKMPPPIDWVHQLRDSSWADPDRLYQGRQLTQKMGEIMADLFTNEDEK